MSDYLYELKIQQLEEGLKKVGFSEKVDKSRIIRGEYVNNTESRTEQVQMCKSRDDRR
jgi:hypothetical protein